MRKTTTFACTAALALSTALVGTAPGAAAAAGEPRGAGEPRAAGDSPAAANPSARPAAPKDATARGYGGAVASVDADATRVGLRVLRRGGNAVDAAIATAAALGVTEPYSAGLGGGGFLVHYDARTGRVRTIDGRETAPRGMPEDAFVDPDTDPSDPQAYPFAELVTSGLSVGVPGTPATWQEASDRWGRLPLRKVLAPAARLARRGFVVDETFALQTRENQSRFEAYTTTPPLFLPGGEPPEVGSVLRNPGLARTYRMLGRRGMDAFYEGPIARQIARLVQTPPRSADTPLPVPAGYLQVSDMRDYRAIPRPPTHVRYRGLDVYGMAPPSSGGSTVGEALNIGERFRLDRMRQVPFLHHYLEATALAFADRNAYVGDPAYVEVPLRTLLSDAFAAIRACRVDPSRAAPKPVPPAPIPGWQGSCEDDGRRSVRPDSENPETTNLTVADRWGNVVEYTLTIEQTGGSGMLVPGRGFLLNNELTDFTTTYPAAPTDPNRLQPGKRPRSSMSPTIALRHGDPWLALGSPGGSTIITTVTQVLLNRVDRELRLADAVAAPRASQRNTAAVTAEQAFIDRHGDALTALGHTLALAGPAGSSAAEIGAVTAVELRPRGLLIAAAEPTRRGGGSAAVVHPAR
jgi:gamma-glutamyltranspeptidase/glutathione hydrolase